MPLCAYCDQNRAATKEHVIPDWYEKNVVSEGTTIFNARRPTTHVKGAMQIRDVCAICNNGVLAQLDVYGKDLYGRLLSVPAYYGETIDVEVDRTQLIRWLTKISFNSGRIHNADTEILRKYRRFILGSDTEPEPLVYVHLVAATDFSTNPPTPARRLIGGHPDIHPARWFRLTQTRSDTTSLCSIVQRQIYIDSFCFALFAVDPDNDRHLTEIQEVESGYFKLFSQAKPIPTNGKMQLTAGLVHAYATILPHMQNYPTRYSEGAISESPEFSKILGGLVDGKFGLLGISISRGEIESADISGIVNRLEEMVANRESALATMQRVALYTAGYDEDSRELWEIPEARRFLQRIFEACPFLFFLAHPKSSTIETLSCCCCKIIQRNENGIVEFDPDDAANFIQAGFGGLNEVTQRLAISIENNRAISNEIAEIFSRNNE